MFMAMSRGVLLSLGLMVVVSGCGEAPKASSPPAHLVAGVVRLDKKPLAGAMLQFIPRNGTKGDNCYAQADASGRYQVSQIRGSDGAQAGEYSVIIEYYVKPDGSPLQPGELPRAVAAAQKLPPKYSSLSATILKATIPEGGGVCDFDLES